MVKDTISCRYLSGWRLFFCLQVGVLVRESRVSAKMSVILGNLDSEFGYLAES